MRRSMYPGFVRIHNRVNVVAPGDIFTILVA